MAKTPPPVRRTTIQRNIVLLQAAYISFLVLTTIKCLVWPPYGKEASAIIWLFQMTPLLVFAYGIFTAKRRQVAGFCYVLMVYFVAIGANMFVAQTRLYTWSGLVLITVLFISGMMHVRWTRQGVTVVEQPEEV